MMTMKNIIKDAANDYIEIGISYQDQGRYDLAIMEFNKAIASEPDFAGSYMARADALREQGELDKATADYDRAISVATEGVSQRPDSPHAYLDRASIYTRTGEYSKAIDDYEKAIQLNFSAGASHLYYDEPFSPYLLRGEASCEIGEYAKAIRDFSRAIEIDADNTAALAKRCEVHFKMGRYQAAEADLSKAKRIHQGRAEHFGNTPDANWGYDSSGNAIKFRDIAEAELKMASELQPLLDRIYSELGTSEPKEKEDRPAQRESRRRNRTTVETFEHYFRKGSVHLQNKEYGRAVKDFDKALELKPKHAESYCKRALASAGRGHYNKAIEFFERALGIDAKLAWRFASDIAPAYLQKGVVAKEKSPAMAMESIRFAIRLKEDLSVDAKPHLAVAQYQIGLRKLRRKRYSEAISAFDKSLDLQPDFADAYLDRGNAFAGSGNYASAFRDCAKAIELNPDSARCFDNRGRLYSEQGEHDRAIEDYGRVIDIDPQYGLTWFNDRGGATRSILLTQAIFGQRRTPDHMDHVHTAFVYSDKGDFDKAIAHYNKAIQLNCDYAVAYNNRGMIYGRRGEFKRAIEDFEQALRVDPNYASAQRNREIALRRI